MKFCRQCGKLLIEEAEACPRCGTVCPVDDFENGRIYEDSSLKVAAVVAAICIGILVLINVVVLSTADNRKPTFADKIMETKAEEVTVENTETVSTETEPAETESSQGEVAELLSGKSEAMEKADEVEPDDMKPDEETAPNDYTGDWENSDGMKMSITDAGDGKFRASVKTQLSPNSYSVESVSGTLEDGAIIYRDAVKSIYVSDSEGNKSQITDYTGGEGYFMIIKSNQAEAAIDYGADVLESGDRTLAWVKTEEPESITDEYVIWYSSDVKLSGMELINLTKEQKKLAVDEIKARHGVIFKDESVRAYFDSKTWYSGDVPEIYFSEDSFSEIEKANIKLLESE